MKKTNKAPKQQKKPKVIDGVTYSDRAEKIEKTSMRIMILGIIGMPLLWIFVSFGVAIAFLVIAFVAFGIHDSVTEADKFATPKDYERFKEQKKKAEEYNKKWDQQAKEAEAKKAAQPIKCPKCGSTQIHADKRGFSVGRAAVGTIATLGVGVVAGAIGKDKIIINCLNCGHKWQAGKTK